jgi:site-specific recombinase XerD
MFKKHVLPAIGDWELAELTPDPLQRLLNQIASRGYRKSMVQHIRTYVRAALEYAVDEGLLGRNPARNLEFPKTTKSRARFYSLDSSSTVCGAKWRQLVDSTQGDASRREILVSRHFSYITENRSCYLQLDARS